jgi:hypothetical protein
MVVLVEQQLALIPLLVQHQQLLFQAMALVVAVAVVLFLETQMLLLLVLVVLELLALKD